MRPHVNWLVGIVLASTSLVAQGQTIGETTIEQGTALRVHTITVRRGPIFNTSRTSLAADSMASEHSKHLFRSVPVREFHIPTRSDVRAGTQVLVNERPTSTMIEHVIIAPGHSRPADYPRYLSQQVTAEANDSIALEYLASRTWDDGWRDDQSCCVDPWAGMCPCRDDQWDCPCCQSSSLGWLNPNRRCCSEARSGIGMTGGHRRCAKCSRESARPVAEVSETGVDACDQ